MEEKSNPTLQFARCNAMERDMLRIVHRLDGPSGAKIHRALGLISGDAPAHNTAYVALNEMVDEGLLEKEWVNGRETAYSLTDRAVEGMRGYGASFKKLKELDQK